MLNKVLVIEHNRADARLIEQLLQPCEVRICDTLAAGLEALATEESYALILLDLFLPDSTGFQSLTTLLRQFPQANIIILSAENDPALGVKAVQAGARNFISKQHLNRDVLDKVLRDAVDMVHLPATFLAKISHELRSPMHGIIGLVEWLEASPLHEDQKNYLATIRQSAHFQLRLINDLQDHSYAQSGRLEIKEQVFEIRPLVRQITTLTAAQVKAKGLSFQLDFDESIPIHVVGDPLRLHQILVNLIENAVKFTPTGTVRVSCYQQAVRPETVQLRLMVADTGIGIPPEKHSRVFELFERLAHPTPPTAGRGIGLYLTKKIVEQLKGSLSLESKVGKGTTVTVDLTFNLPDDADVSVPKADNPKRLPSSLLFSVLVVEDHPVNQVLLRTLLENKWPNATVITVNNGAEALATLAAQKVDIVLMDIQMPVMDGWDAGRQIQIQYPGLPVLALTADLLNHQGATLQTAGFVDQVLKPISPKQLYLKVAQYLNGSHHK